jgi:uncharacterized protein YeaO (DUF488 family)
MGEIQLARVYDHGPHPASGPAFLVERLWPRGVRRDDIPLDGWCKDVAPSTELRKWFGHDPAKWAEFRRRYNAELDANPAGWQPLAGAATNGTVTLLYSSRDREHNNAVVLRDYLLAHLRKG